MTKSSSGLLLGAALALTVTAASAEDLISANGVLPGCRDLVNERHDANRDRVLIAGLCAGIIRGIVFMAPSPGLGPQDVWQDVCLNMPKGVTPTQQIRVVIAYIDARPARIHELFDWLAFEALRDAWPCK
jgi:hypothetical protein